MMKTYTLWSHDFLRNLSPFPAQVSRAVVWGCECPWACLWLWVFIPSAGSRTAWVSVGVTGRNDLELLEVCLFRVSEQCDFPQ